MLNEIKIEPIERQKKKGNLLDQFHGIFSKLHHIFSNDDKLVRFLIQTTYIAFHEDNPPVKNSPEQQNQNPNFRIEKFQVFILV